MAGRPAGLGVLATVGVTTFPMPAAGGWPQDFQQWARVWLLPILVGLIAAGTFTVAQGLRRSERRRRGVASRMRDAVRSSAERALTIRAISDTTADAVAMFDAAGNTLLVNSLVWVGPPGAQLAISFVARPVKGPGGEVLGAVIVGHDVTALIEAVEVHDNFLATVGHELKTPLTAILGHAALLEGGDEASRRSTADELRQATDAFYRTPFAEKQAVPGLGLGLGLTIARKLAGANRATLDLESISTGTRATLRLPAA